MLYWYKTNKPGSVCYLSALIQFVIFNVATRLLPAFIAGI